MQISLYSIEFQKSALTKNANAALLCSVVSLDHGEMLDARPPRAASATSKKVHGAVVVRHASRTQPEPRWEQGLAARPLVHCRRDIRMQLFRFDRALPLETEQVP
jgi:hypothetical protein